MKIALATMILASAAISRAAPPNAALPTNRPVASLPTNRPADRATVFSTTHRYAVSGCPAAQGVQIATWAEDVEQRFSRFIGATIPSGEPLAIQFLLADDPTVPRGRIARTQCFNSGMLDQRLDMINPRLADQEDLLEALCSSLLTRLMTSHLPASARTNEPPRAPDWLAVGIAQNLWPEARQRNTRTVVSTWRKGGGRSIREILRWEFMPSGRWDDKAEAGKFIEYMLPPPLAAKRSSVIVAAIESGELITPEFLVQRIFFCGSVANAEKMRDLWSAHQQDNPVELGGISPDRLAEFVRMLEVRPADHGIPESSRIPLVADLRDLIRLRGEKWVTDIALRMSMKMQTLAMGQAAEFQRVIAGYVGFLDALAGTQRGILGNRAPETALKKLLDQAEAGLVNFQTTQKQRDTFLKQAAESSSSAARDPISSYLDEIERRAAP